MSNYIKLGAAALVAFFIVWFSYDLGYEKAKVEGELQIETLKLTQAEEVISAQNRVKIEYEKQIQNLNAALASVRSDNAHRLRQLEAFRGASTDLATCRRDLNDVSAVAVGLESIALRADSYLRALVH